MLSRGAFRLFVRRRASGEKVMRGDEGSERFDIRLFRELARAGSSLDRGRVPPRTRPRTYQMGMAQRLVLLTLRVVAVEVFDTGAKAETATFGLMRSRRLKLRIAGVLGDGVGRRRRREAPRAPRANIYSSGPLFLSYGCRCQEEGGQFHRRGYALSVCEGLSWLLALTRGTFALLACLAAGRSKKIQKNGGRPVTPTGWEEGGHFTSRIPISNHGVIR